MIDWFILINQIQKLRLFVKELKQVQDLIFSR